MSPTSSARNADNLAIFRLASLDVLASSLHCLVMGTMRATVEAVIQILAFGFLLLASALVVLNVVWAYRRGRQGHGPSPVLIVPSVLAILGVRLLAWDDFLFFLRYTLVVIAVDFGSWMLASAIGSGFQQLRR